MSKIASLTKFLDKPDIPDIVQVTRLSVLLLTLFYCVTVRFELNFMEKTTALSILGFLPEEILFSTSLCISLKVIVITSTLFWFFGKAVSLSPILSFLSFTTLICFTVESQLYTKHMYHIVNVSLFAFFLWEISDPRLKIPSTRKQIRNLPYWVYFIMLFYIASTYSLSGLMKLMYSGSTWLDGTGLQVWIYSSSRSEFIKNLISNSRELAMILQAIVLSGEFFCGLILFFPKLRIVFGIILAGFHTSVEIIAGLQFYGNIILVFIILILAPLYEKKYS
jgi:hypothetical protein